MNLDVIKKHPDLFTIVGLFLVFYFIFIFGIGSYPLMDIDETRYASMAHDMFRSKDFMTLYLNGEYFFEKPPLFFWIECLSFALFGKVNEFTVRFPVAIMGVLSSFLVYFVGKKVISRTYGIFAALILATSAEFFILSKFAILDMVLTFCTTVSIFSGFMTLFCQEKNKKYFWWLFYIFSGLAVLAKGIPGFVLPFGTMFFVYLYAKKFKELFNPIFLIPGFLMFFAISLPWHLLMLDKHDPLFFNEYIMKHHVARFTTSADLGRKQPFWFFAATLLWGFFPWIIPTLSSIGKWGKSSVDFLKAKIPYEHMKDEHRFVIINAIAAVVIFVFFSASSSKLVTYILPIYPFLACLSASIFYKFFNLKTESLTFKENPIMYSAYIFGGLCLIIGFVAAVAYLFLDDEIEEILAPALGFGSPLLIVFGFLFLFSYLVLDKKLLFIVAFLFMTVLSAFGIPIGFNIDYAFGQNELIQCAKHAKVGEYKLASFGFGRRFSLNYYYQKHVIYEQFLIYENLDKLLQDENMLVVVKTKDLPEIEKNTKVKFKVLDMYKKYTLIKG